MARSVADAALMLSVMAGPDDRAPLSYEVDPRQFLAAVRAPSVKPESSARTKTEPHLGLGLFIVRLIAEFHRGTARAHNREDGRGVVVEVTFPLAGAAG